MERHINGSDLRDQTTSIQGEITMKKFIAAAAGLALAGTMATTAMAEVNFGGSARVRGITMMNYKASADSVSKMDSRVRLKVNAKAKGGASAHARIRMADGMWDGGKGATGSASDPKNIYVDYAYIKVPVGPVTVQGGRQIKNFSKWFSWDGRADRLSVIFKTGGTKIVALYDKNAEITSPATTTTNATVAGATTVNGVPTPVAGTVGLTTANVSTDWTSDNDKNGYALVVVQKLPADWMAKAILLYLSDETPAGNNGIVGSFHGAGKVGGIKVEAEFSFKDFDAAADTQFGGYVSASMGFGAMSVTGLAGMTVDGFQADNDFGLNFLGNGNNSPITWVPKIGMGGDTVFAAAVVGYKVSPQLSLSGVFGYAAVDGYANAIEISGGAKYTISDGAALTVAGGALIPSDEGGLNGYDDTAIGAYAKLEVKY